MAGTPLTFKKHRPVDKSDPGFSFPGRKLRWVSARVSELDPGRPWMVIRKSELPPDLVKHITDTNPESFAHGDTIRRGELILAFASDEKVKELKQELHEKARDQERSVARAARGVNNPDGSPRAKVEINEDRDVTREMVQKFKKNDQD